MEHKITVREIIKCWENGGIDAVKLLINESKTYENTWEDKIKKLINQGNYTSVNEEISLVSFNLNLKHKLYNKKDGNK